MLFLADSVTVAEVQAAIWRAAALRFMPPWKRRRFIKMLEAEVEACEAQLPDLDEARREVVMEAVRRMRSQLSAAKHIKA